MNQNERDILLQKLAEANQKVLQANNERDAALKKLKEYEEMTQKAEKASKMKSLFLANMSHEIRTPLNAIEGFSRIMAEMDIAEERMKFLEIIESSNNRLQSLINEILDLSRVENGEITFKKDLVELNQIFRDTKQVFKFRCSSSVKLVWNRPNINVTFNTDANRLQQVLSNLISNALKHTTIGNITFGYQLINDGQEIEFFVSDTGTGIAKEDQESIFLTYVSKDAETMKNSFGLGLPLSKIIVEKMGGTIRVESELGKGTKFTFVLPFEGSVGGLTKNIKITTNSRTLRVSTQTNVQNMKTILVAEDEDSNYELVRIVLNKRYRLVRAKNGIEAVTMNEEEKPDLILMDIRMPEMNGLDATRIIKEVNRNTPIVALSAYAFEKNIREAKDAGCDEFMAKPFKVEELIDMIRKYITD